jgi:hypothetical protein
MRCAAADLRALQAGRSGAAGVVALLFGERNNSPRQGCEAALGRLICSHHPRFSGLGVMRLAHSLLLPLERLSAKQTYYCTKSQLES